ncbi:MAG TPA: chromate efflux transporter [Povalibacter sp.]
MARSTTTSHATTLEIPHESLARLFLRFLRFGALAWGGPVAQIAMLRHAFVDEDRWVTSEHFNRVLALYQVLPGPEAHELCVYFGMLARGRIGGVLAGLGFMLPGFLLMFALSWAYVSLGLDVRGDLAALFAAIQAAVVALIVRAVHRIGSHVLLDGWAWAIAVTSTLGHLAGVHFSIVLLTGGACYVLARRWPIASAALLAVATLAVIGWVVSRPGAVLKPQDLPAITMNPVSLATLFWAGLKTGSLTFGGAYTAIPFLQHDAVNRGAWMSDAAFMDGIALAGLLPAPLIIFATFVGYVGGGPLGAVVLTTGIFLPAFALTLIAHEPMEKFVHNPRVRSFLDGVTAAVVGLIAGTAVSLVYRTLHSIPVAIVFIVALVALFRWNHRWLIPVVIAGAALFGLARTFLHTVST